MAATQAALRRQISSAGDLKAVVRTMKAAAASALGQYERSVAALAEYAQTVELGLGSCLRSLDRNVTHARTRAPHGADGKIFAVVFGSDQGLVGRFNDELIEHALKQLAVLPASAEVWAVGQRVQSGLSNAGLAPAGGFAVPGSVQWIAQLVGQILLKIELPQRAWDSSAPAATLLLFYNRPTGNGYRPVSQRLLPLDEDWQRRRVALPWPTRQQPDVLGLGVEALSAFVREHVFVSLFRASAESLASENASRLAAMQRADRNIDERLKDLGAQFHQARQRGIDEELFEVIAGFDAIAPHGGR